MIDLDAITELDKLLEKQNVLWSDKDIETLLDNDEGDRMDFYIYYEDPTIPKKVDLTNIANIFSSNNDTFKLTELVLTKNNELRARFRDKSLKEEQIIFY